MVVLKKRLENAVALLNPGMPLDARQDACRRVMQSELPSMLEENRRIHKLMTEGVDVEYYADDGTLTAGKVSLIDFQRPEQNDWLVVSQFVVVAGQYNRRPDVVVFVNCENGAGERCRRFAYLLMGIDVVGILRNGCGYVPRDNKQISKAPAP